MPGPVWPPGLCTLGRPTCCSSGHLCSGFVSHLRGCALWPRGLQATLAHCPSRDPMGQPPAGVLTWSFGCSGMARRGRTVFRLGCRIPLLTTGSINWERPHGVPSLRVLLLLKKGSLLENPGVLISEVGRGTELPEPAAPCSCLAACPRAPPLRPWLCLRLVSACW